MGLLLLLKELVQLRYLAVGGHFQSIAESVSNLWKLETFIVKGLRGKIVFKYYLAHGKVKASSCE